MPMPERQAKPIYLTEEQAKAVYLLERKRRDEKLTSEEEKYIASWMAIDPKRGYAILDKPLERETSLDRLVDQELRAIDKETVKLYGAEWCEPCQQIKRLLEKFGIPFEYIETDDAGLVIPKLVLDDGREITGITDGLPEYLRKLGKEHREAHRLRLLRIAEEKDRIEKERVEEED